MLGWMKHKLESKFMGEISIASDTHMTTLMAESEEELKGLLMKVKEESEKVGLKPTFRNESYGAIIKVLTELVPSNGSGESSLCSFWLLDDADIA